uniref:Protein kinase domain-containing protein n=1 Tax=Caenorhabditis tropicalis TaxID=1561998 RepID=A0A1I7V4D7_9PELO
MSVDPGEEDVDFKPGHEITSKKATYVVEKLLGEGGFGAVYKVKESKTGKLYALKVEKKSETKPSKLKMEIAILKLVSGERKTSHFTEIVDRGKKDKEGYFFLVMELAGASLADLKKKRGKMSGAFSPPTALSASLQCLEACEDLHKYGYIHRDLKPANYACGADKKSHTIYILDFGISRKILNDRNELKTPRVTVRFKGTIKFASMACHKGIELGWKDDCESWFYLLLDLILPNGLQWRGNQDKGTVCKAKEEVRSKPKDAYQGLKCWNILDKIITYIDQLQYQDHVDYHYIYRHLTEVLY